MIEIIRQYIVKEKARAHFELTYGPGGAWGNLFGHSPGFRGTTVLRDTGDSRRYLVVDLWETEAQWEQVLAKHRAEYASLEAALAEWCESSTALGTFRVLAEATVRPPSRARRKACPRDP